MRASLLLLAGTAVLAGVRLIARPGEPAPAGGRIVVVRGGAAATRATPTAPVAAGLQAVAQPAAIADPDEAFGDPGVWAIPAEFAPPERSD